MKGNRLGLDSQVERKVMAASLLALMVALVGCGGDEEKVASKDANQAVPVSQTGTVAGAVPIQANDSIEAETIPSADSLPPELEVSVESKQVAPGAAIEITALGSPDVRDVVLTDEHGKTTSFVYDVPTKSWRAYYRAPMKVDDRLGLSVTAKNDAHRWRRVWLFLEVQNEAMATPVTGTQPDSTKQ